MMVMRVPEEAFAEYQRELKKLERRRDRQMKRLREHHEKRLRTIEGEFYSMRRKAFEEMEAKGKPA